MEGDRPGRQLHPEELRGLSSGGEDDEEIGAGLLTASKVGVKTGRPAVAAGAAQPAPRSGAQRRNRRAAVLRVSFPAAWLLPAGPGSPGGGNPKDTLSICEPCLAQLELSIWNEGEKLHLTVGFPFQPLILL